MNALVSTRNVTKIYNKNQLPRLNKVSFDIQAGEFVGIMGASGSGKTTLLNILSTIDTPTDGDVFVNTENKFYNYYAMAISAKKSLLCYTLANVQSLITFNTYLIN